MCRFHYHSHAYRFWLITCEVTKALPPNFTHRAVAELWMHGESIRKVEFQANDLEAAVEGLLERLN